MNDKLILVAAIGRRNVVHIKEVEVPPKEEHSNAILEQATAESGLSPDNQQASPIIEPTQFLPEPTGIEYSPLELRIFAIYLDPTLGPGVFTTELLFNVPELKLPNLDKPGLDLVSFSISSPLQHPQRSIFLLTLGDTVQVYELPIP